MDAETSPTLHLVLRYADKDVNTIAEHQSVASQKGSVWFGKLGKALGKQQIERLNRQCEEGTTTFVYLVLSAGKKSVVHRAKLLELKEVLSKGESELVPAYYRTTGIMQYVKLWIRLSGLTEVDRKSMERLEVAATGSDLLEAIGRSSSGQFIVKISNDKTRERPW
ncbi:MAG TPA: hypothetical protein PKZ32_13385 [Candidatus Melainabacteria bacterium]|nr:hypothetical protein [Candidatus Melainabacteria bacterium]